MRIIQSPEYEKLTYPDKSLFLAGGISNCNNWQNEIIEIFQKKVNDEKLVIVNPRRDEGIDFQDVKESTGQIMWEHSYLDQAKHILFWFPAESVCPITLFEYGKYLYKKEGPRRRDGCSGPSNLQISVGTHPDYIRKLDISVQTMLVCDLIKVHLTLDDLVEDVIKNMSLKRKNV